MKVCLNSIWNVWRSLVTIVALSLILLYVLGSVLTPGPFLIKLDQHFKRVFYVDTVSLEVAGHDFGTFFDPTLLSGIRL